MTHSKLWLQNGIYKLYNSSRYTVWYHPVSYITWYQVSPGIMYHLVSCITWYHVSPGIRYHPVSDITRYQVSSGIRYHFVSGITQYHDILPVLLSVETCSSWPGQWVYCPQPPVCHQALGTQYSGTQSADTERADTECRLILCTGSISDRSAYRSIITLQTQGNQGQLSDSVNTNCTQALYMLCQWVVCRKTLQRLHRMENC